MLGGEEEQRKGGRGAGGRRDKGVTGRKD